MEPTDVARHAGNGARKEAPLPNADPGHIEFRQIRAFREPNWNVCGLSLEPPPQPLPEIQASDFEAAVSAKAKAAAAMFGRPVLVDDAGLVLEAYDAFPGPLTLQSSADRQCGLARLLSGVTDRGAMECHLGCWVNSSLRRGLAVRLAGWTFPVLRLMRKGARLLNWRRDRCCFRSFLCRMMWQTRLAAPPG